jgi:hypothetical protein
MDSRVEPGNDGLSHRRHFSGILRDEALAAQQEGAAAAQGP